MSKTMFYKGEYVVIEQVFDRPMARVRCENGELKTIPYEQIMYESLNDLYTQHGLETVKGTK